MIPAMARSGPLTVDSSGMGAGTEGAEAPSLTYAIDWERGVISGKVNGLAAVRQAVVKILRTERFEHLIYGPDYGMEWKLVLGKDRLLARAEAKRLLTEALLQDERITELSDFRTVFEGDAMTAECTVHTLYGSFQVREEVSGHV